MNEQQRTQAHELYQQTVTDHRNAFDRLDDVHRDAVIDLAADILSAWKRGGRLLVAGNGGSAADAQHLAAELVGRFRHDRPALAAVALATNASTLTAVANDFGYDHVFARQVEALGQEGDVLLVISTSGNSPNCTMAAQVARKRGLRVHGLLGKGGGVLLKEVDGALIAPSDDTPRIQEIHITMCHLLCEILETALEGTA